MFVINTITFVCVCVCVWSKFNCALNFTIFHYVIFCPSDWVAQGIFSFLPFPLLVSTLALSVFVFTTHTIIRAQIKKNNTSVFVMKQFTHKPHKKIDIYDGDFLLQSPGDDDE